MNKEMQFLISWDALRKLYVDANKLGISVSTAFRRRTFALARSEAPQFSISGDDLEKEFVVGVNPEIYPQLIAVADRLGVPHTCIGELVCTFNREGAIA